MLACTGTREERIRNDVIEAELKKHSAALKLEVKVLMLGRSELDSFFFES